MTAEADIAAVADGGDNTPADVRAALTSVLARADAFGPSILGSAVPGSVTYITPDLARRYVRKITVPADGVLLSVAAYIRQTVANVWGGRLGVAVYDDGTNEPGKLLGLNEAVTPITTILLNTTAQTPRWFTIPVNTPVTAGTYWVAFWWQGDVTDITLGTDATTGVGTGISGYMTAGGAWWSEKGATGHGFTATNDQEQLLRAQLLA